MVSLNQDEECQDSVASVFHDFEYDVWVRTPSSVEDRKNQFLKLMSLDDDSGGFDNRMIETSGAVQMSWTVSDSDSSSFICRPKNLFDCCMEEEEEEAEEEEEEVEGCNSLIRTGNNESSPLVQKLLERQVKVAGTMARTMNRVKNQWLSRLRSMTCVVDDGQARCDALRDEVFRTKTKVQRVRVRQNQKRLKELSAVFIGQDIQAHRGSILTMKFSHDGRYLATAGEDGVVRVWQVVEDDRSNDIDIPDIDPSCLYFTVNHLSELAPLMSEKQKMSMLKGLRKTSDSACVIVPPKVFRILEKPVHEFHGHMGEVLDLSWSKDNFLLSSSVDETVRLWRLGSDQCHKVFPHSNYVTCVQFNPVDESYFISGSIDGKIRIWSVDCSQVVDWTDIREIITAVAYNPDGKGGIIGSMTGCCRLFSLTDNHFQLEGSVCLNSKKKSPCKRIISFQFCPQDPGKVMVTCADSHVRILDGINVIGKYKGQRKAGNQLCASFTSDGKHIVSACEDSNVYVWKWEQEKTVRSFECFSTREASVVLPWCGLARSGCLEELFIEETIPSGSGWEWGTWPEEKLGTRPPGLCNRREYRILKKCWERSGGSDAWGLVIVTAGWDGHIRSFLNYGLPLH